MLQQMPSNDENQMWVDEIDKKETIRNNDSDNIMWDNTPCQKIWIMCIDSDVTLASAIVFAAIVFPMMRKQRK